HRIVCAHKAQGWGGEVGRDNREAGYLCPIGNVASGIACAYSPLVGRGGKRARWRIGGLLDSNGWRRGVFLHTGLNVKGFRAAGGLPAEWAPQAGSECAIRRAGQLGDDGGGGINGKGASGAPASRRAEIVEGAHPPVILAIRQRRQRKEQIVCSVLLRRTETRVLIDLNQIGKRRSGGAGRSIPCKLWRVHICQEIFDRASERGWFGEGR